MKTKRIIYLYTSAIIVFILIFFLNQFLIDIFDVKTPDFVWQFYYFLTGISALMIMNLFLVHYINRKYVGYTFLAWALIKLMLIMAYFLVFVMRPGLTLSNAVLYNIVSLYFAYLIYEVFFSVFLLKEKIPTT